MSNALYLAELIIEIEDKSQIKNLKNKIDNYNADPSTVFSQYGYCYDTKDNRCKISRGGTEEIKENIEWFLLIDNLSLQNFIVELDISSSQENVIFCLDLLAKRKGYELPKHIDIPENVHKFTGSFLAYYSKEFNKNGLTLINFYINSDSYVTALIKKENLNIIKELAHKSGNIITEYNIQNIDKI